MIFLSFVMPSLIYVFPTAPPRSRCMLPDRSSGHRYSIRGFIGNIFDEGLPIGERVSIAVSCNQGYTAQPSVQTECLERGVWSVAVPICGKPGYSNFCLLWSPYGCLCICLFVKSLHLYDQSFNSYPACPQLYTIMINTIL